MNAGLFIFNKLTWPLSLIFFIKVKKHSKAYTGEKCYREAGALPPLDIFKFSIYNPSPFVVIFTVMRKLFLISSFQDPRQKYEEVSGSDGQSR